MMSQRCIWVPSGAAQAHISSRRAVSLLPAAKDRRQFSSSRRSCRHHGDGHRPSIDEKSAGLLAGIGAAQRRAAEIPSIHAGALEVSQWPVYGKWGTLSTTSNSQFWGARSPGRLLSRHGLGGMNRRGAPYLDLGRVASGRTEGRRFTTQSTKRQRQENGENASTQSTRNADGGNGKTGDNGPSLASKMIEAAATSLASILVLAVGFGTAGYIYHKFYKHLVLKKMTNAFEPGDPVLELAAFGKGINPKSERAPGDNDPGSAAHWVQRPEQGVVDQIVSGNEVGHYHLIIGEKGSGKSSMLLEAMRKIDGYGVAMFEAHADLEIFRIRLGKALDYEFHEDYIGGYFSERGPRDTTALLDIERALNKLEKVALKRRARAGRPLVLIINQMHLVRDDEDGKDLIELLQQRAEQCAAANLVTMVFNSDDYWVYERLKQLATRMEVLSVTDLPKIQATAALQRYRSRYFREKLSNEMAEKVYDQIGGRLTFLNRVAKSKDMMKTCEQIIEIEKTWFLNQCWILGSEMDDDVMDQQKWAAAAMVLALALVDKEAEMDKTYDPIIGHILPSYPLHKAQELMTRADFVRPLDRLNLFSITSRAQVRASSVPMHRAFREICSEPGFRIHLDKTIQRIADIESLGRTRELVAKDLVLGGRYEIGKDWTTGAGAGGVVVTLRQPPEPESD